MKISKWIIAALAAVVMFTSCSKDNDDKDPVTIDGVWKGTYHDDATGETLFFSLRIEADTDLFEVNENGQDIGFGGWQIDNTTNVFMAEYAWNSNGQHFSLIAAFDAADGKLIGNWGYDASNTDGGTFELEKQ